MAISFSKEQQTALDLFDAGQTICLTGPGGTGKSLLIREMYMRAKNKSKKISVTALTGCAAYLLVESKARTIHSWSGIYRFNDKEVTRSTILKYLQLLHKKRKPAMKRWLSTDILIIDEISMMSASFLTLLDGIGRELRSQGSHDPELRKKPFGGIQLIFVGDFLQIPPVIKESPDVSTRQPIFESKSWRAAIRKRSQVVTLKKNFRALQDVSWASMLLKLRQGICSRDTQKALESRLLTLPEIKKELDESPVKPTVLVSTRLQVDAMNITNLTKCPEATEEIWEANAVRMDMETRKEVEIDDISKLTGGELDAWRETIDNSLIPETLVLREGAQVMCLSNIDMEKGIVNGARGVVRSYDLKTGYPVVLWKTSNKETVVEPVLLPTRHPLIFVKQIPLCQAWAITIHKSQGQTLDCVEVDIGTSVFVSGQSYVALSRVRSLDTLYIRNFSPQSIWADPYAKRFCAAIGDT